MHLGCEKEERVTLQPVEIDLTFFFPEPPEASVKDSGIFACYDKISQSVRALCEKREFRLIEYLGMEIYRIVRGQVTPDICIAVKATKCSLPVAFILGGASFSHCDLPPFSWVAPY